jgi:tocopherol O-methyltransferase
MIGVIRFFGTYRTTHIHQFGKMTTRLHLICLLLLNGSRGVESFTRSGLANSIQGRAGNAATTLFGVRSAVRRVRDSVLSRERTDKDLKDGIAFFYDRSSKLWEDVWGEHMHHGYYIPEDRTDHVQAQIDLIDEVLKWAGVDEGEPPKRVVDVGCGIGGSSRHIVRKYEGSTAQGITLSPYQANRGNELAREQGVSDKASFQVRR